MTLTFLRISRYGGSVASSSPSLKMWFVDETSFACWRPLMKIVGL